MFSNQAKKLSSCWGSNSKAKDSHLGGAVLMVLPDIPRKLAKLQAGVLPVQAAWAQKTAKATGPFQLAFLQLERSFAWSL